jgi:hypothetical protein
MLSKKPINALISGLVFVFLFLATACRKGKGAICNDGWRSHSTGSGTCSWHGGVDHYIDPNEVDVGKTVLLVIVLILGIIVFRALNRK